MSGRIGTWARRAFAGLGVLLVAPVVLLEGASALDGHPRFEAAPETPAAVGLAIALTGLVVMGAFAANWRWPRAGLLAVAVSLVAYAVPIAYPSPDNVWPLGSVILLVGPPAMLAAQPLALLLLLRRRNPGGLQADYH